MEHSNLVKKTLIVVENYRKGIQRNIDQFGASYSFCMDVPLSSSVEVFNALKAEGYNVSSRGESFGKVRLVIILTKKNDPINVRLKNGLNVLIAGFDDSAELKGKDYRWLVTDPDLYY